MLKAHVILRVVRDYGAVNMCQAMLDCGVEPFSVVRVENARYHSKPVEWHVFGTVDAVDVQAVCDELDARFEKLCGPRMK